MTNEEKAQEICEKNKQFHVECSSLECYLSALDMSRWKDEQFINFLEWIDNVYVLRRFSDGESINFKGLVEKFKLMQKNEHNTTKTD
jgi:hypothetical protein